MRRRSSDCLPRLGAAAANLCLMATGLALAACGGSSNSTTYSISGVISGLTTSSVVLENADSTVTVPADSTAWKFSDSFAAGALYSVTVKTQPTGELCLITSASSGKLTADVTSITVVCSAGLFNWEGGENVLNTSGNYGTQKTAAATNLPGAREAAGSWADSSGNVWLFGGYGYAAGVLGDLSDLWQYS